MVITAEMIAIVLSLALDLSGLFALIWQLYVCLILYVCFINLSFVSSNVHIVGIQ